MSSEKVLCRVSLDSFGVTPVSSWIEARKTKDGFDIYHWTDFFNSPPAIVARSSEPYNWRAFARQLMTLDEDFITSDAIPFVDVSGESGIRAECLRRAWAYPDAHDPMVDFLLAQSEDSIDYIDETLQSDPAIMTTLVELAEQIVDGSSEMDLLTLLRDRGLPLEHSFSVLKSRLKTEQEAEKEALRRFVWNSP